MILLVGGVLVPLAGNLETMVGAGGNWTVKDVKDGVRAFPARSFPSTWKSHVLTAIPTGGVKVTVWLLFVQVGLPKSTLLFLNSKTSITTEAVSIGSENATLTLFDGRTLAPSAGIFETTVGAVVSAGATTAKLVIGAFRLLPDVSLPVTVKLYRLPLCNALCGVKVTVLLLLVQVGLPMFPSTKSVGSKMMTLREAVSIASEKVTLILLEGGTLAPFAGILETTVGAVVSTGCGLLTVMVTL